MICGRITSSLTFKLSSLSLKSGITPTVGCKADLYTDHARYNAVSALPKRPMGAFFIFAQEERPKVSKMNPNLKIGEITKEIGQRYKSLPEHKKQQFFDMSKKNFAKYQEEMAALKKTEEGQLLLQKSRKEKVEKKIKKEKAKITLIKRETNYPKKVLAHIDFMKDLLKGSNLAHIDFMKDLLKGSNSNLKNTERFVQANAAWKDLPEEEKQIYRLKAEADYKNFTQKVESWETANPDAVTQINDLQKNVAKWKGILKPKIPKKKVKKAKAPKKVVKKKKIAKKAEKKVVKKVQKKVVKKSTKTAAEA